MGRLIDEDDIIKQLDPNTWQGEMLIAIVKGLPTAYNVDKVVERLEKLPHRRLQLGDAMMDIMESKKTDRHFVCLEDVIGIVKGVVKDEPMS